MRYCDLRPAIEAYRKGENVTQVLRLMLGEKNNTPQIIEIAYDLQAGTYVQARDAAPDQWRAYVTELAAILRPLIRSGDRVFEAGTGEMTTLIGVANACYGEISTHYAMDISWSRIAVGRGIANVELVSNLADRLSSFVGDLLHIPLRDKSIDVVWTSHALEPNGGREEALLAELFRITRRWVVLFEPSYENNTSAGQARMDSLGYVKGLPGAIRKLGGTLENVERITAVADSPNPTYAYVVAPPGMADTAFAGSEWACPATGHGMVRYPDCFWSEASKLAYPVVGGVPILRPEAAVLATRFADAMDFSKAGTGP